MSSEKEVVLRDWELLKDDEQIVRHAATKGKYINACFQLLSERQEVSIVEARKFFYIHVILYVHRLLNNRQVFKADHVLKNIGFDAKNVFFEISKESSDSALRDYLLDHCKSSYDEYESHLLFLEEEWMVFNRLKHKKEMLIEEFREQKLVEFDLIFFDAFCKLDLGLKNKMVAYLFFKEEDITLVPHLDKYKVWEYFVAKEKLHDLKLWTNNVMSFSPSTFEETLFLLYQKWKVDQSMFNMAEQQLLYTEAILYGVAKCGCFSSREQENIRKLLHRIVTIEGLGDNSDFLKKDRTQNLLLKLLEKKDLVHALDLIEPEFMKKVIDSDESPFKSEMVTLLAINRLLNETVTKETVFSVSRCLSEYVLERNEGDMTDDQKAGAFLEHLLEDTPFQELLTKEIIPLKFQHLQSFIGNAFLPEDPVELEYLLKRFLTIDIKDIGQTNFDRESNYLPTFNLLHPVDQDIYPTKLSYLHYVKQGRGIYASYYFFLEHLRQYSKVTTTHALLAAENVTEVALQNLGDPNLVTHCISFMENIGIDTQKVRALIRCLRRIDHERAAIPLNDVMQEMFDKLACEEEIENHVVDLEAMKLISDGKSEDFKKGFCALLSQERSWYKLLLVSQYMNLSMEELFQIVTKIPITNVRKNLMLAIQYDKVDQFQQRNHRQYRKRRNTYGRQKSDSGYSDKSTLTISHFMHANQPNSIDLIGAVLQLTKNYRYPEFHTDAADDPFKAFLKHITDDPVQSLSLINYAWHRRWPVFAVLAAVKGIDVSSQYLGIVWLATSIDFESESLSKGEYQTFDAFSAEVVSFAVKNGFTETLSVATKIFYQNSAFSFFAEFLNASKKNFRKTETIDLLKKYLIVLNSEELSPVLFNKRNDGLVFSAQLLLFHVENNFPAPSDQLWILNQICEIGHFDDYVNFPLMRDVLKVLDGTELKVTLGIFDRKFDHDQTRETFVQLCMKLKELKLYEKAIKVAKMFNLQINEIIFEYWHVTYEEDPKFSVEVCERNMKEFGLQQDLLIKFYLSIAQNITLGDPNKYLWFKNVLDFIQKYTLQHSDWIDLERLESQLVVAYVHTETFKELPLYHSQHFTTYVSNENGILYNTLEELKIIAGLEELSNENPRESFSTPDETNRLNFLINILLQKGDVVQALRYQRMFNQKSTDLHFTTLCMSLAEKKLAPHELAVEERKAIAMDDKIAANKFNRRTLLTTRLSQSSCSSSPNKPAYLDSTSDTSGYEFEEIPSREKQAIKEAIQNLAGKVKNGSSICRRVVQIYRASMYMDLPYEAVYKRKDSFSILKDAVEQETLNKLLVISDLISASKLTAEEVASFISNQLAESIIKSRFYLLHNGPTIVKNVLWGFNLDTQFHLFLDLCPNTTLFGNYLLLYCEGLNIYRQPTIYTERKNPRLNLVITSIQCILQDYILSQKKQNSIQIELLIKAHLCFLYECSMEGIAEVLQKAKALVNVLTNSKSWNLIIKLLTGIGKYKEMFYCFEILIENQQFEALLKKCDEEDKGGLQNAIMLYLREYCPNEKRYYQLAAAHFSMYKELADLFYKEAENMIMTITQTSVKYVACHPKTEKEPTQLPYIKGTKETNTTLQSAMDSYASSAEFYILDQKLSLAQMATGCAELIALQICLINLGYSRYGSICVLRANDDERLANYLVNNLLTAPQSLVLSRAIGFNVDWARAIFEQYVQRKDEKYLVDFLERVTFTEAMLDDVFKIYAQDPRPTNEMKTAMLRLLSFHTCSAEKYRPLLK